MKSWKRLCQHWKTSKWESTPFLSEAARQKKPFKKALHNKQRLYSFSLFDLGLAKHQAGQEKRDGQKMNQNGPQMMTKKMMIEAAVDIHSLPFLQRGMVIAHPALKQFTILNQVNKLFLFYFREYTSN